MKYPVVRMPDYCMVFISSRSDFLFNVIYGWTLWITCFTYTESGYTCVAEVSLYSILLHRTLLYGIITNTCMIQWRILFHNAAR